MPEFRLQSVLDLKQRLVDAQQQALAALALQQQQAEDALRTLAQRAEAQQQALAQRGGHGPLDLDEVQHSLQYIEAVRASIEAQRDLATQLEAQVRESRERLTALSREQHMLERLRDRHLAAAALEADRRDQRDADELSGQRFARRERDTQDGGQR